MEAENHNAHQVAVSSEATSAALSGSGMSATLASPQAHFDACLERAARGLCEARNIDPDAMMGYDNGTMAYTMRPAWQNAAAELREAWLIAMFVRTLP